jgi:hypothetical protein
VVLAGEIYFSTRSDTLNPKRRDESAEKRKIQVPLRLPGVASETSMAAMIVVELYILFLGIVLSAQHYET